VRNAWVHDGDIESASQHCPCVIIVMGAAGSGKTTVAKELCSRLDWAYLEADDFHPVENREKMRSGVPLTDDDRWPWLRRLADEMGSVLSKQKSAVLTCSALKKSYREVLVGGRPHVYIVHLHGSPELIQERCAKRQHQYMPASLAASQFATLEPPSPGEALVVDIADDLPTIVSSILSYYGLCTTKAC